MWYTLCTDELPSEAANTVCTQLGYTHSDEADIRFVYLNILYICIKQ